MKCPNCSSKLKRVEVKVHGATSKATSYQCGNCDYFEFDADSAKKVVDELKDPPLKIKQKIIKISQDRLGFYFTNDVVRSLNLKKGQEVYVSVPDKKHILLEVE